MKKLPRKITAKGKMLTREVVRKRICRGSGSALIKTDRLDAAFMKLAQKTFSDWNSVEDAEAFQRL